MSIPADRLYTKEHEWVKVNGKQAIVGITDYAQHALGDITFVEVRAQGTAVAQFKQLATVESVKAASDVYAPLSGNVTQINAAVIAAPETLNKDPYDTGWLCVLDIKNDQETKNLMSSAQYAEHIKGLH